ncbi:outer membrane protein assembly factor BamE [Collimonas sp. NPDC087041]|uniref:OmpA family protein n=1 Tax=Collimonas sp. NPDC087041 TaxID=3363960 RepID=UPI00382B003E
MGLRRLKNIVLMPVVMPVRFFALSLCVLFIGGCGEIERTHAPTEQIEVMKGNSTLPNHNDFPAIDSAKWRQGTFPSIYVLRTMQVGMDKDQVRLMLGSPHFNEGLFGVREWNYIFHFRNGDGNESVVCQYMVRFDADMLVAGTYWRDPDCDMQVNPPKVKILPALRSFVAPEVVIFDADSLFRLDGGAQVDLLPAGRTKIERLALDIKRNFKSLHYVLVSGYTDRLNTAARKATLSLLRANTIRELLAQYGIDKALIRVAGMGDDQPLVQCPGNVETPQLLDCLRSNRRVEIEIVGED